MSIDEIESWVGARLPVAYRAFLGQQVEDAVYEDVRLYGRADFIAMNDCHKVKEFCRGYVTIGDDGGGRQFLLALDTGRLVLVDAGSLDPSEAETGVPEDFAAWLAAGCLLPVAEEPDVSPVELVAIYIEQPLKTPRTLVQITDHLKLDISIAVLKKRLETLPCLVAEHLTYAQAIKACAKVNAVEACLGIRLLRDRSVRLPLTWKN
jgi:hypothetical protein